MSASRLPLVAFLCGLALVSGCKKTSGPRAAKEDLQLVPKDTQTVLMANLARMRGASVWRKLEDVRDKDPKAKQELEAFVKKCGLDPFKQIDSVFVAVPSWQGDSKDFAAILRGAFNEQKLVACAREQSKKDGGEVTTIEYGGKKLYGDQRGQAFAVFLDAKTAVIGSKGWTQKVVDLAAGKPGQASAKENQALAGLMKRTRTSDAMWGAGIVPQSARDSFKNDPNLAAMSSMTHVFGSMDFASGFKSQLNVDTGSEADAKEIAAKVNVQLAEMRKSPQVMMMGLATYIDGVKVDSKGPTFILGVAYNQQQVDDLIARVSGLLKSLGGALGAGAMPPGHPAVPAPDLPGAPSAPAPPGLPGTPPSP